MGALAALGWMMVAASVWAIDVNVDLTGAQEVPPVQSTGQARGSIRVNDDRSVTGSVTTVGVAATAAHIHQGAAGSNGGVLIPLFKNGDVFSVPAGTRLSDAQFQAFRAGNLYVNVHSTAFPDGEVRAQLKP